MVWFRGATFVSSTLAVLVQVNTLEGRPAASSDVMHEAPTAPDVHQVHCADVHADWFFFCSQLDAVANDT